MPQDAKSSVALENKSASVTGESMTAAAPQGLEVDASDERQLRHAIELAFHYRGDVTIVRRSNGESIEGYLFDRDVRSEPGLVRIMPVTGGRVTVPLDDIDRLIFSGRDTAAGKSFETWLRKYVERKLSGKAASIDAESLDG